MMVIITRNNISFPYNLYTMKYNVKLKIIVILYRMKSPLRYISVSISEEISVMISICDSIFLHMKRRI